MTRSSRSTNQALPPDAQPCIWMSAGLLSYKLCDRAFDCEHCALDAALRGEPRAAASGDAAGSQRCGLWVFPDDRLYRSSHVWVQPAQPGRVRIGIDAFAVHLIDSILSVTSPEPGQTVQRGDAVAVVESTLGSLPLRSPCPGTVCLANPALRDDPALLLRSPYDDGWLAELSVDADHCHEWFTGLAHAPEAVERVRLDLQRFRRQVAMHLLTPDSGVGVTLNDGGERLTTLPQMLGPRRYLAIVQELLS